MKHLIGGRFKPTHAILDARLQIPFGHAHRLVHGFLTTSDTVLATCASVQSMRRDVPIQL
jgi:hypothetical protein